MLVFGIASATLALGVLAWPVNPLWPRIYSPYQVLEFGHNDEGLMIIRAAGHYYPQSRQLWGRAFEEASRPTGCVVPFGTQIVCRRLMT